ncbi:TetR/AcrR family transcriptional regulator [Candidatus Nitrospira bockiana]
MGKTTARSARVSRKDIEIPAAAPGTSRVERKKSRTRRLLLDMALALFYEKGIYWTKIEDITERADIGKGTFYQYFETKEALLHALLKEGLDKLLAQTKEGLRGLPPSSPDIIRRVITARLDFFLAHPEFLLLFHQVRGLLQLATESAKDLRQVYIEHLDQLADLLRSVTGKRLSPRELATAIVAFTSGMLTYHLLFDKPEDFARRRADIQARLERSISALVAP